MHYRLTPAPMSEAMSWMASVGGLDERLAALRATLADRARPMASIVPRNPPETVGRAREGPEDRRR